MFFNLTKMKEQWNLYSGCDFDKPLNLSLQLILIGHFHHLIWCLSTQFEFNLLLKTWKLRLVGNIRLNILKWKVALSSPDVPTNLSEQSKAKFAVYPVHWTVFNQTTIIWAKYLWLWQPFLAALAVLYYRVYAKQCSFWWLWI